MANLAKAIVAAMALAAAVPGCKSKETPEAQAPAPVEAAAPAPAPETPAAPARSAEEEALFARLQSEKTAFAFEGQSLPEALSYLSARHGVNIVVDEAIRARADKVVVASLRRQDVLLAAALDELVGLDAGLRWDVRGNVVFVRAR